MGFFCILTAIAYKQIIEADRMVLSYYLPSKLKERFSLVRNYILNVRGTNLKNFSDGLAKKKTRRSRRYYLCWPRVCTVDNIPDVHSRRNNFCICFLFVVSSSLGAQNYSAKKFPLLRKHRWHCTALDWYRYNTYRTSIHLPGCRHNLILLWPLLSY